MKTVRVVLVFGCTALMLGTAQADDDARRRAAEWYEKDKAICAEERVAERRVQCLRDARAVYDSSLGLAKVAPAAPASAAVPAAPATPVSAPVAPAAAATARCADCGTITAVRVIEKQGDGTGLGAVVGGLAGAIVGKQFGGGDGKKVLTVAGAAGGAYAGHQVEKNMRGAKTWEVSVRMDDGTARSLVLAEQPVYAVGDPVRIEAGQLRRR